MNKKHLIYIAVVLFISLQFFMKIPAKDLGELKKGSAGFRKTAQAGDPSLQRAIGILEKGKLKTTTWNYGVFTGSNFFNSSHPEGLWGQFQYVESLCFLFGVPGKDENGNPYPWAVGKKYLYSRENNRYGWVGEDDTYWGATVSESYMDRTRDQHLMDWEADAHAIDNLHGNATVGEAYGGQWAWPEDLTPLMATSDVPNSWPVRLNQVTSDEERFWPGHWALDPTPIISFGDTTHREREGVFVSDEDVYFEFDDRLASRDVDPPGRLQGYPIGVKALVSAYSYRSSVAEDIIFFNMKLVNVSDRMGLNNGRGYDYEGAYGGFWFDVDAYSRRRDGSPSGRSSNDDMMRFNADHDFAYIWDLDDYSGGATNLAYSGLKLLDTPRATETVQIQTEFGSKTVMPGERLGLTDWHFMDWYYRPMADDRSRRGPFTGDGRTPNAPDGESILYKIMSGDTSGTDSYGSYTNDAGEAVNFDRRPYNRNHYFYPDPSGRLYPHFDSSQKLQQDYPGGLDCVFIMSSGPFKFEVGDTIPFSFAMIMGKDLPDLEENARIAQLMYDNLYGGPTPPRAPNVSVLEEDQKITLFWDDVSLNSKDAITGIPDFEGFRIYKSTDNGLTWGEKRFDDSTNTSYYEPIAQFDLDNEIAGYDPTAPHRYLGNNSGITFQFTDENLMNGQEYLYAVTAYDRGFIAHDHPVRDDTSITHNRFNFRAASQENYLSNSAQLPYIVRAIPHRPPTNVEQADVRITKIDTTKGNGQFRVKVTDKSQLTEHDYLLLFHAEMENGIPKPGTTTYDLIDMTITDTLLNKSKQYIPLDAGSGFETIPPRLEGMELTIKSARQTNVDQDNIEWKGQCDYNITANFSGPRVLSDYRVVFKGGDASKAYKFAPVLDTTNVVYSVPFEVWNLVTRKGSGIGPRKAKLGVLDTPPLNEWSSGDKFLLYEDHIVGRDINEIIRTLYLTFTWKDTISYDPHTNQPIPPNNDWAAGDTLIIPVFNPFQEGDGFIIRTNTAYQVGEISDADIQKIRVVPNPYIARAGWEMDKYTRKLQFTNLPSQCSIYIFNVAGELVNSLEHDNVYSGTENWNLRTSNQQEAAPGLYIWVVKTPEGKKRMGKFTIIR